MPRQSAHDAEQQTVGVFRERKALLQGCLVGRPGGKRGPVEARRNSRVGRGIPDVHVDAIADSSQDTGPGTQQSVDAATTERRLDLSRVSR